MKRIIIFISIMLTIFITLYSSITYATTDDILNSESTSKLVEMSETQKKQLEDYKKEYGSDTYGFTAWILNAIRIYSIPFCFLGIAVSAIYQYVIGIRKLDVRYKGFYTMIAFITIFVICQVLPLVFVIVIKGFGRS